MSEPCRHERLDDLDLCHNASQWRVAWQGALQGHRDAITSLVAVTAERDEALAGIERVRALHTSKDNDRDVEWCAHDMHGWPCPTIAALEPSS